MSNETKSDKKWIKFLDREEASKPVIEIKRTVTPLITKKRIDAGERVALNVKYSIGGFWEGAIKEYNTVDIPGTTHIDVEGAPSVPKDGIFVALPMDAEEVQVKVVDKSVQTVGDEIKLVPSPKQFKEEEFKEVYEPDPKIYQHDDPYPGKDFDFLGIKVLEGVKVAHLLVYLGQYRPISKRMDIVQSMNIELSYKTPPSADRVPVRRTTRTATTDLILGIDLLEETKDFESRIKDIEEMDEVERSELEEEGSGSSEGISMIEHIEEDLKDPSISSTLTGPTMAGELLAGVVAAIPKLKIKGKIAEYIIITTKALAASVEPLRIAKANWPYYSMVALTDDISSEFPSGSLKESIRSFLQWANKNYKIPPKYVVLAGDTDTIPIHIYNLGGSNYASDHFYADLEGDLVPEVSVSRLATSDTTTLKQVCEYIAKYGDFRGSDWGGWQNNVMLCAYESAVYETAMDNVDNSIKCRYNVIKRYAKNTTKPDIITTINNGVLFAVYRGHGSKQEWSSSNGLNRNDVIALNNSGRPPFVMSICCQNGWIDDNSLETISEAFLRHRKSVAVFASSRNSWTYPNNDFSGYLFDAIMTGKATKPAEIIRYAKTKMLMNHPTSNYHKENLVMYNLIGDPSANVTSNADYLLGDWDMNHDGWSGVLKINNVVNPHVVKDGNFCSHVWDINGVYVGADNKSYPFSGTFGGFDEYVLKPGSKRCDYRIDINIAFSGSNNQRFKGYLYSWNKRLISGITWWSGRPFGWHAKKK